MRRQLILASFAVLVIGCGVDDGSGRSNVRPSARLAEQPHDAKGVAGPWRFEADVEPRQVGPLVFSAASLQVGRSHKRPGGSPFIRGRLGFDNAGDAPILLKQIDYSAFSEDEVAGNQLLLAEGQCGYGKVGPGAPVEPGVCTLALLPPIRIAPMATQELSFALFTGLRGMAPLEPGKYRFTRRVRFTVGESTKTGAKRSVRSTIVMTFRRRHRRE